jgi:hypothetical protein
MAIIKETPEEQKKRRQINKAAGTYLCDQDEGDNYDAYLKLQEESSKGNGDNRAADFVTVWQPLENSVSVDEMLQLIDCAEDNDDQEFPEVLKKIDWTDLRTQKTMLLETINNDAVDPEHKEGLEGILSLIDALQDFAVDEMGVNSIHVYDFEKEDEREGYKG